MNLIPVAIISLILLVIAILLAIADRLLANYGECKITVHEEDKKKEFAVQGGGYLLQSLTENGIKISSSCGGKATCGYCKVGVISGGGQLLPTEEIFMSRADKIKNMRLACQVKVKNDIEVYVPDFLTIVRDIVRDEKYDHKAKWIWTAEKPLIESPEIIKARTKFAPEDEMKASEIIKKYRDMPGAIMPILQEINDTYNYLPESILRYTAGELDIALSELLRTATFYSTLSLEPRGRNIIRVCLGTACHVKGADGIISVLKNELGIDSGETTEDMLFTLEEIRCLGCCGLAPVLKLNEEIHGLMTQNKALELIEHYRGT